MIPENRSLSFRAAILSLSLLTIMSGAGVAPGVYKIAEAFPETPVTIIKLIVSLPPLLMIISALLSGFLGQFIKHKTLIVTGLILFVIGGVGTGYMQTIPLILLFRGILGFGTGMILPFSTGLIAACFDGKEKVKMMGYSSASNCLGAMVGNTLAGILAIISWRYMFQIYWLGGLVLFLVILFLKDLPEGKTQIIKEKLPGIVFLYGFYAFLTMMIFFLIVTNLSFIINLKKLGSTSITGYLFALNAFTMLLAGILLPKLLRLKNYLLPIIIGLIAFGIFGMAESETLLPMILSVLAAGFGLGTLFPYLLNTASQSISKSLSVKAMSIAMAFAWLGQFVSPLFFGGMASLIKLEMLTVFRIVSGITLTVAAVIFILTLIHGKSLKQSSLKKITI